MCKIQHFSERKIHFFGQFLSEKFHFWQFLSDSLNFQFWDEKLTFVKQKFAIFNISQSQKFIFWEIPWIFNFFDDEITFLRQNLEIFGRFVNNFQTPILKNWQFLPKNLHFSEPKFLVIFQQFLDQNYEKLDIFRAKNSFSDNFGEIPLFFNYCTKNRHLRSKNLEILTIFWKIWNFLTQIWHF